MKTEIIKVNNVDIECPQKNEVNYVAIKPICEALGIDHQKQYERIKGDEILKQLYTDTVYSSAKDGKLRNMFCLPVKYVFGWIFSIDASKVNEEAKPAFMKYKRECYDTLYEHFFGAQANRTKALVEKTQAELGILSLNKKLDEERKENATYLRIQELKAKQTEAKKQLKSFDSEIIKTQLELFQEEEE